MQPVGRVRRRERRARGAARAHALLVAGLQPGPTAVLLGPPAHLAAALGPVPGAGRAAAAGGGERVDLRVVQLVRAAQEGNAYAFAALYDLYVDRIYGFCHHRVGDATLAEDLTADVFTRALQRIRDFTWQGKDFGAWLFTIARNRCHDHFRSARFRLEAPVAAVADAATPARDDDPEAAACSRETRRQVHAALARMKDDQAEVLHLRFIVGLDVAATGQVMGRNPGAIRALQYRALKALAQLVPAEAALPA